MSDERPRPDPLDRWAWPDEGWSVLFAFVDEDLSSFTVNTLRRRGWDVNELRDSEAVLAAVAASVPAVAVVGEYGLEIIRRLRADPRTASLPIVVASRREHLEAAYSAGAATTELMMAAARTGTKGLARRSPTRASGSLLWHCTSHT